MAAVRMHIDKFGGVVLIDENHPLAVAQRVKPAPAAQADTVTPPRLDLPVESPSEPVSPGEDNREASQSDAPAAQADADRARRGGRK